ncbi:MAG: sugar transporter [Odoribacter sp.]
MLSESRTSKSLRNVKVALVFYFINLILQFFSRKIFLEYLGAEVLGLNTTAQNLLGFLNLAELGIGGAIAYTLYKPLFHKDIQVINEIVSVQGWMYRKIAYMVIAGACVLMCFFPWIFAKAEVPLCYAYGSFIVLLVSSLLGYFINYRQVVLTADQKEYKITLNVQGYKILKVVLQILVIRYLADGYVYWMILELMMAFVTVFVLNRVLRREYPWLVSSPSEGKVLQKKYSDIITKTKQMFFHQIGHFVLLQTSPLIIYAYASLTLVAIYGNYLLIVTGVTLLMNALLNSVSAGVGSLVAEGNKVCIKRFFWELTSCRIWIASVICFGIYELGDSFIRLWVGNEYILERPAFIILIVITFISLTRTNDTFLSAYGLYQDIWAPLTEACLNLGCSIGLGYFYGLPGILLGVAISLLIIVCAWKPYFLYKCGFKESIWEYISGQGKYFILLCISFLCAIYILNRLFPVGQIETYGDWLTYAFQVIGIYGSVSLLFFYSMDRGMRDFSLRIKGIIYR